MAINNTQKEMPTGDGYPTAGNTINALHFPTEQHCDKAFSTLWAAFALCGHNLHRNDPVNGPVSFWAGRLGLVRYLPTIDAARQFLEQFGGRL